MRKVIKSIWIVLLLVTGPVPCSPEANATSFVLRPGTCSTALEMLWEREAPSDLRQDSGSPLVTVDIGGEFVPETRVVLTQGQEGVRADVLQVLGGPLCKQLEELQESKSFASLEEGTGSIKVLNRTVQETEVLSTLYRELRFLQVRLSPSDTIFLPARGYKVSIDGLAGSIEVQYAVPEQMADGVAYSGSTDLPNSELRAWVDKLLKHLSVTFSRKGLIGTSTTGSSD